MALTLTHEIIMAVDSESITIKNTTPLSEYTTYIPAITTEALLSTATTVVSMHIEASDYTFDYTVDLTAEKDNLRTANGSLVNILTATGESIMPDNLYAITFSYTISGTVYTSIVNNVFYAQTKNDVAVAIMSSEWKDSLTNSSKQSSSKYALKTKSWFDQLVIANDRGLYTEALTILNSLKSIF